MIKHGVLLLLLISAAMSSEKRTIPPHPDSLSFKDLAWKIPEGEQYRHQLRNGTTVYIASDNSVGLIKVIAHFRYGSLLDPDDKKGLSGLYAQLLRSGGTKRLTPEALDEEIELYAATIDFSISHTRMQLTAEFLSDQQDKIFSILDEIINTPRFAPERLNREKEQFKQMIRHRFDNPGPTAKIAYNQNMYSNQALAHIPTEETIDAVTRDDILKLHKKIMATKGLIIGISGDFEEKRALKEIKKIFSPGSDEPQEFPKIRVSPAADVFIVNKHVPQAEVRIGFPYLQRPHPDYYPVQVMNMILGGSGFTSRLTTKIRSDAGLTYSIYSVPESRYRYPATYYVGFHTKTESVPLAIAMSLAEIENIQKNGVSEKELAHAKKVLIEGFPSFFRSRDDIVDRYSWSEFYGRSSDHFRVYPDKINAVTLKQVQEAAQKYLNPDSMAITIVADTAALFAVDTLDAFHIRRDSAMIITNPDSLLMVQ